MVKAKKVKQAPAGAPPSAELKHMLEDFGLPQTRDGAVELVLAGYAAERDAGERRRIGKLSTPVLQEILFDCSH